MTATPRRLLRRARRVVVFVAFSVVVFLVGALVVVPRATGGVPLAVLSGSMRPTIPPGATVVVRPVDVADLEVGDIITYQLRSGDPTVVTHRIVGISRSATETTFTTQGDANPSPDPEPVHAVQVRGKVWYVVPFVGRLTGRLDLNQRGFLSRIVAGALLAWAVTLVGGFARDRRLRRRSGPEEAR